MLRALLATIFAVLTASAVLAVERFSVPADSANHYAAKFDLAPAQQGEDQIDIDKQPCLGLQDWSKAAVQVHAPSSDGRCVPLANDGGPPSQHVLAHLLFLYACAPRAPPSVFPV